MSARRIAAIALTGALVAGGTGAAIAAVTKDDGKKHEQAILDDAAKRLNVTPEKLREALAAAEDAQLDEAVKAGDLTQKQADALKEARKQSGRVLGGPGVFKGGPHLKHGFGPGPGLHFGGRHGGPFGDIFTDLAKALGITRAQLEGRLRDGKSIAAIAKAEGKSLADVRAAVKAAVKTRVDKAVDDGDLTRKQADAMLEHFDLKLEHFDAKRPAFRHRGGFKGHGGPPPLREDDDNRPGAFIEPPGGPDELPAVAPAGGVIF